MQKTFKKKKRIATCTKEKEGVAEYAVSLFADSTFLMKNKSMGNSHGTFNLQYSRCYFLTKEGKNDLCEFYYVDSLKNKLLSPKNCVEGDMDIRFGN